MNGSNRKIVAIHQPNFLPWLGYFNKIVNSDVFVILDNVQLPKSHGTWSNRVEILINGESHWITLPIVRSYNGTRLINETKIDNSKPWRKQILKSIQRSYAKSPFFNEIFPFIEKIINFQTDSLSEYNLNVIIQLMKSLSLDTSRLILSSSLDINGQSTDLLISIVKAVGGTTYLCGGGASGYQIDKLFESSNIELIYQNFEHPVYEQKKTQKFIPGMSIVDVLMNCGYDDTFRLLNSN